MEYARHTDEEIREVAEGIVGGRVFTDRHLERVEDLTSVFMVVGLMGPESSAKLLDAIKDGDRFGMMYEFMEKAMPLGVNGMPCFASVRVADADDTERIWKMVEALRDVQVPG